MLHTLSRLLAKLFGLLLSLALIAGLTVVGFVTLCGHHIHSEATSAKPISIAMGEVQAKSDYTPLTLVPQIYQNAVVATEDQRFYTHNGYDVIGTTRAILSNIFSGEVRQGGSTITQQLARNLYYSQEQTITRKIAELFTARAIEKQYSKEDILACYMSTIYYGDGYYSLASASWGYFGVAPSGMSDYQATLLAGVPNAPSVYAPTVNPDLAAQRQLQVLRAMVSEDYLTKESANAIVGYQAF